MKEKIKELTAILGKIKNLYAAWAKDQDKDSNMATYVYMIYTSGPKTQAELAALYGIPKQTLNSVVSRLETENYIISTAEGLRKRRKQIRFTPQGLSYAVKTAEPLLKSEQRILEQMGRDKVNLLIDLLNEYASRFEWEIQKQQQDNT